MSKEAIEGSWNGYTKAMWQKYEDGDGISDGELDQMILQIEDAIPYLEARRDIFRLCLKETRLTLETLLSYKQARRDKTNGL